MAIVTSILARGAKVATFARTISPDLAAIADEYSERLHVAAVDATDQTAVTAFISGAEEKLGPIDALVNNAAVGQDSLHAHTAPEHIERILHTNLTAPLILSRAVLRRIISGRGTGRLVFVTSICAQRGYAGLVAYSAAKGGLDSAMRALAREMHGRVLANSVAPGFFASEMSSALGSAQLETISRRTPSGRLVEPGNIVPVIDMLLFEDTNINGQTLVVDGGSSI